MGSTRVTIWHPETTPDLVAAVARDLRVVAVRAESPEEALRIWRPAVGDAASVAIPPATLAASPTAQGCVENP
jgi:hypothetical protein